MSTTLNYFPLWMTLIFPPLVFLVLAINLMLSFTGSFVINCIIEKNKPNMVLKKVSITTLKLLFLSIIVDFITTILYLIPEFFYTNTFLKENLIINLETNPYNNIISLIYIIFIGLINLLVIYGYTKKIVLKDIKFKNKLLIIPIIILMFPYIYFVPSNKVIKTDFNSLSDYKGTNIANKSKIKTILKYLETTDYINSYIIDTSREPYTLKIYIQNLDFDYQILFEKDASVIFNLVDEVNEIIFYKDGKNYRYTINYINSIFNDVKKLSLDKIYERYSDSKFDDYTYLGRVGSYDLFDISEYCELESQLIFENDNYEYYLSCTKIEQVVLYDKKTSINIKDAILNNIISYDDLLNSNIDFIKKEIED